jgi:uncharacterized protein
MTLSSLRGLTRKDLAVLAKKHQIAGWHQMTKDELVAALATRSRRRVNGVRGRAESTDPERLGTNGRRQPAHAAKSSDRALGGGHLNGRRLLKSSVNVAAPKNVRDVLTAEADDPFWIHVRWTLSRDMLDRAEAALATQWHHAVPILRVFDVTNDEGATSSQVRVRDVEIHGDVDHWYLPVEHAPRMYKVQIGYRAVNGLFFVMAQSNRVQTPRPGSHSLRSREASSKQRPVAEGSASNLELEKMPSFDLRAFRTAKSGNGTVAAAASLPGSDGEAAVPAPVELCLHAELIVHGSTDPQAELKLLGDRIPISRDGTFSHRFSLPEGRQVIDAVVTTRNGCHQRTIVLGIERNTKELEPQWFDEINA